MGVFLGTLCLNEAEWLPYLYDQHKDWPELSGWCFVEAADRMYAEANPGMVSKDGLSVDDTSKILGDLAKNDPRVTYIPHGFSDHRNPAVCKAQARQRYLEVAGAIKPEFVIAVDADEFYCKDEQPKIIEWMRRCPEYTAWTFPRREIWRPPSIIDRPLFRYEVVGGFWGIACCHWWRWEEGMHYSNCHNAPNGANGQPLNWRMFRYEKNPEAPQMIHLGYASSSESRLYKHKYYSKRGESKDQKRKWYVRSRSRWFKWKPGDSLPSSAEVRVYEGPVPEVFR